MPDLFHTLRNTDLDFLKRLARTWKIDLTARDFTSALEEIQRVCIDQTLFTETVETLPPRALQAWNYLIEHRGKESWSLFSRKFGELRVFGIAKRSREEPDLHPVSAVEELWYRALIGRAFLDIPPEPQEFAYIPDEFFAFTASQANEQRFQLRPAAADERRILTGASDVLLDDATETLAALRMGRAIDQAISDQCSGYTEFLTRLLLDVGILADSSSPDANKVKDFLASPRGEALAMLFRSWRSSKKINDLRMLPNLLFEGNWRNDALAPRELVIHAIAPLDPRAWWSLNGFISQVREKQPDFQRPAGDYDSWFIRNASTNEHLHGVEHWDEIEGKLLYYLVTGPLHWLGVTDLAQAVRDGPFTAFRLSSTGTDLVNDRLPVKSKSESGVLSVASDGIVRVPNDVPRAIRYQVARFCTPLTFSSSERKYRITPASLRQAGEQGLKVSHLMQLFQQAKVKTLPPNLQQQLERWEKYGSEAEVEKVVILHLARPELLALLQKNPRVSQSISAVLNTQTAIIKPGKVEQVRQGLAELGLLTDIKIDSEL